MVFSSLYFLLLFLPVVLLLYLIVPRPRGSMVLKNLVLLLASIYFYAWGEPVYVFLMIFSILFNYVLGLDIDRRTTLRGRRSAILFAVVVNLFILGFFKYYGFLINTINAITPLNLQYYELSLPIGISFYTFQIMSYLIDVYRGSVQVQRSVIKFATYITMFPQLVAGPIVKYSDIAHELDDRKISLPRFGQGLDRLIKGLAKKVLLANNLGMVYTAIQAETGRSVVTAWLGIVAYTLQIYFDFSGYSDMAIGMGKMFGFTFSENFDHPYLSQTVTEFWRRWHISLSSWFRDYVYIPLGGNRVSAWKHIRNILVVWMLTGLWHGASWNFVLWGLYYGLFLLLEKYLLAPVLKRAPALIRHIYTLAIVMIGWVLFSNTALSDALRYLGNLFGVGVSGFLDTAGIYYLRSSLILLLVSVVCCGPPLNHWFNGRVRRAPWLMIGANVALLLVCISYLVYSTYNPFLYFRF